MNKTEKDYDYQKEIKIEFNKHLNKVLKELNLKEEDICEKMLEEDNLDVIKLKSTEQQKFRIQRYDYKRNISLRAIKIIKLEFDHKPKNEHEKFEKLFELWIEREKCRDARLKPFLEIANCDLIWIANNLEKLLEVPEQKVAFLGYLSMLNDVGKKEFNSILEYVFTYFESKNEFILRELELDFVNECNFLLRDKVDCLLKIEKCEKFWKIRQPETRNALVNIWKEFYYMDEFETEIYLKFISYDNKKITCASYEQIVMATIALALTRYEKYQKKI